MTRKTFSGLSVLLTGAFLSLVAVTPGPAASPDPAPPAELKSEGPISNLGPRLAGTAWRAVPLTHTHPGLTPVLTFARETVAPADYPYKVISAKALIIHFSGGGTQKMTLSLDGRHLQFSFEQSEYTYELIEQEEKPALDLKTQLAGTTWKALPMDQKHPGLASTLTFSKDTVAPDGYSYEVDSPETLTIHFNHGGIQLMVLDADGKHLEYIFNNKRYEYERSAE